MSAAGATIGAPTARVRRRRRLLWLPVLLALATACSTVRVQSVASPALLEIEVHATRHDPAGCRVSRAEQRLEAAMRAERRSNPKDWPEAALIAYLDLAQWSYAQLAFGRTDAGECGAARNTAELRTVYNHASERFTSLLFAHRERALAAGIDGAGLALRHWRVRLGTIDVRLPTGQARLTELVPASGLRFDGVHTVHRRDGIGAAFVAVAEPATTAPRALVEAPYHAATVLLRFPGDTLEQVLGARTVELDLLDPTRAELVRVGDSELWLADNLTAPYALWIARSKLERQAGLTLFKRAPRLDSPRVYAMQPYDPTRQTIVLLHGLGASPATWVNLLNEIVGDPTLRRRYQVWLVFYPTNLPPAETQRTVRQALRDAFAALDPSAADPASAHVTLIGHSMGGVIARLLVLDTGDALWRELFGDRSEEIRRSGAADLEPYLTLEPLRQVDLAIFIAAPHRGAPLASGWRGRLAARLIRLPVGFVDQVKALTALITRETHRKDLRLLKRPTSVRTLSDEDAFLQVTASLPISPAITYHTIVGRRDASGPLESSTDGLVPYSSAHLDGAASELVIRSGHHVHDSPEAIAAIARILRERGPAGTATSEAVASLDAPFTRPGGPHDRNAERRSNVLAKH